MNLDQIIVVKIGSSTLVKDDGRLDKDYIDNLCAQVAVLRDRGKNVVIVSSGAVACGREVLALEERPKDIPTLQACASCGQALLTQSYAKSLSAFNITSGQVLLTRRDVVDREGYLNARNTLTRLLEMGVVPIVNENDTVSVAEFTFGDNDMLGAIVAALVNAELFVMLSDVDGLYTANPQTDEGAELIERVKQISPEISALAHDSSSDVGTGGMSSKVRAARAMIAAGIPTLICHGRTSDVLTRIVNGEALGTRFEADKASPHEAPKKLWIGLAEIPKGSLTLDEGATCAVMQNGASVLPVGVTELAGEFKAGDVVNVYANTGELIGRGCVGYDSLHLQRYLGLKLEVIERFEGSGAAVPAIHRDELLVF